MRPRVIMLILCNVSLSIATFSQTLCNCYWPTDCRTRTAMCEHSGGCLPEGKNDGTCQIGVAPPSMIGTKLTSAGVSVETLTISSALDAYFRSFIKAVENGGGHPDSKLLQIALNAPLSETAHNNVERAVWISLDAVLGWDFQYPTLFQKSEGFVGNIREVDGVSAGRGIVDAARQGLIAALKTGDVNQVDSPLRSFWSKNPRYMPRHLGRCYPHGHEQIRGMDAAVGCQIDVLHRVAAMLIGTAGSSVPTQIPIQKMDGVTLSLDKPRK